MEKVIKYKCSECGELFDTEKQCFEHEDRHKMIEKANNMLDEGYTLQEIQNACNIWYSVPEHLQHVNKDNCFIISWWQGCEKPAYQIVHIRTDGRVRVSGCGSWSGYYFNDLELNSHDLRNVHSKDELYVDLRYERRMSQFI